MPYGPGILDPAGVEEQGVHTGVPQELGRSDRLRDRNAVLLSVYRIANTRPVVWCCGPQGANDAAHIAVPLGEHHEPAGWTVRSRSVFTVPKPAARAATDKGELTSERSLLGKEDVR
jgi:hypothetical protein